MALTSMTGFARLDGHFETNDQSFAWTYEIKGVNGKSLDIRFRLPPLFSNIEPMLRKQVADKISRGNLQVSMQLDYSQNNDQLILNEGLLSAALATAEKLTKEHGLPPVTFDGLLGIKGILDTNGPSLGENEKQALEKTVLDDFSTLIDELVLSRSREGTALQGALSAILNDIESLVKQAQNAPERQPEMIADRLKSQIADLMQAEHNFSEERLYQEALIMAAKADIKEEIDRLFAHIEAAHSLLLSDKPSGRRLDFLSQEFSREANTLCSKANHIAITNIGLALKGSIDQFREQVQNVE